MNFTEITSLYSHLLKNSSLPALITSISSFRSRSVINDYFAIQVIRQNSNFKSDSECDIVLEDGTVIGKLCVKPTNNKLDYSLLTEAKYIAYLNDVSLTDFHSNEFILHNSYLLIKSAFVDQYYENFYNTAPLWGGFFHHSRSMPLEGMESHPIQLTAIKGLKYPSKIHQTTAIRSILEPFAFERFLKKYHQIELLSDLHVVEKIRKLNKDLYGVGNLLSEISSNELTRLKLILSNKIYDYDSLARSLYNVTSFRSIAKDIFQNFSKNGNPLADPDDFQKIMALPSFDEANIKTVKRSFTRAKYDELLLNVASYWIYRIRCSIAHQRIGEYIISPEQEDFLLFFGEPLVDSLLIQILKD